MRATTHAMVEPAIESMKGGLSLDTKTVLFGLGTAALTAVGLFLQKMNGVRHGNAYFSLWIGLAVLAYFPTFLIANRVFQIGGRMSLYVPMTAASYVISMLLGRVFFGEPIGWTRWIGGVVIVVGIAVVARA